MNYRIVSISEIPEIPRIGRTFNDETRAFIEELEVGKAIVFHVSSMEKVTRVSNAIYRTARTHGFTSSRRVVKVDDGYDIYITKGIRP